MAGVPGGVLSFLYNVTYDTEFNKRFSDDEEEVMEFFQIPLRLKEVVRRIHEIEKQKNDDLKKLRNEAKANKTKALLDQLANAEEDYMRRVVVQGEDLKIVLQAIEEELNGGVYRRFW